ncbi:MAG: hypothetical protein ABJL99_14425 [Aliishimia sp.]
MMSAMATSLPNHPVAATTQALLNNGLTLFARIHCTSDTPGRRASNSAAQSTPIVIKFTQGCARASTRNGWPKGVLGELVLMPCQSLTGRQVCMERSRGCSVENGFHGIFVLAFDMRFGCADELAQTHLVDVRIVILRERLRRTSPDGTPVLWGQAKSLSTFTRGHAEMALESRSHPHGVVQSGLMGHVVGTVLG